MRIKLQDLILPFRRRSARGTANEREPHTSRSADPGWRSRGSAAIQIAFWSMALLATFARVSLYGDPRLAIASTDTQSYIDSSRAPLWSKEIFTGRRLFTTNLIFKIVSAPAACGEVEVSMPAVGEEGHRLIEPCFGLLAALQESLSVAAWLWLAFVVFRRLGEPMARLLGGGLVLLFSLAPQIEPWDSILGSESLSISLFTISFGFMIEIVFSMVSNDRKVGRYTIVMGILWLLSFSLWLFVRDANLFAVPVLLVLLAPLLFSWSPNGKLLVGIAAGVLVALFAVGLVTSRQSTRWQPSIQHSLEDFVFPYPARVEFMSEQFSMPDPASAEYPAWFSSTAPTAFSAFLVRHPGFAVTNILDNWTIFTHSYEQPYFALASADVPEVWLRLGEMLHPASGSFYLVDAIALVALCAAAIRGGTHESKAWAWLLVWLYLAGAVTLLLSYFGDTAGIMRHICPSLIQLRLFMWLALLVLSDAYMRRAEPGQPRPDGTRVVV